MLAAWWEQGSPSVVAVVGPTHRGVLAEGQHLGFLRRGQGAGHQATQAHEGVLLGVYSSDRQHVRHLAARHKLKTMDA